MPVSTAGRRTTSHASFIFTYKPSFWSLACGSSRFPSAAPSPGLPPSPAVPSFVPASVPVSAAPVSLPVLSVVFLIAAQSPQAIPPDDVVRELLLTGRVTAIKTLSKGITRPRRVTLTNGTLSQDAVFQSIDEAKPIERNFDCPLVR